MANIIKGNRRRHLKRLNSKRNRALKENYFLSEQERKKLENKVEIDTKILSLTLDNIADHHYDY